MPTLSVVVRTDAPVDSGIKVFGSRICHCRAAAESLLLRFAPSASQLAGSLPELGSWDEAHSILLTRSPGADGEYAASFEVAVSGSCPDVARLW